MARQKGFIKIKGSLGGLTFYEKDGADLIRTTGGPDKQRIERDPAFKRTRENMREFGASATVGKALRQGYASIVKRMSDTYVAGRLTGVMKQINNLGPGLRGERTFQILPNSDLLEGFEFNEESPLDAIFYAPFAIPTLDVNRSIAVWTVPDFDTGSYLKAPEGATHFKLLLATAVLSDYEYNELKKEFVPVHEDENTVGGIAYSSEIPLKGMVGEDIILSVDLGFEAALPDTAGVVSAIGIVFYQEINGSFYELASDNAMQIIAVG